LVHPVVFLVSIIDTCTSLEEDTDVCSCKNTGFDQDLEGHHELESYLVSFEETSVNVSVNLLCESLDNILDTILDELSLLGLFNCVVEKTEELLKGSVVHPVDLNHLDDTEVKYGTTSSDGSELLTLFTDFKSLLTSFNKFVVNFAGLKFNVGKHINKLNIIKERTLSVS
jgi:hypothetical protein